jgi:PEGA domain
VASNVMAVAVSTDDGKGTLITNAAQPVVLLDGKETSASDTNGVDLSELGKTDHDLQVTENKDRQRFVLTYTPTPTLTLYVKADPNAGTVVVTTGQDEADVYVNDKLYRKRTDRGQVRVPLKVGEYTVRVHKAGFMDPPPQTVQVSKAEESPVDFKMEPTPEIATLQVKGALPGTMVYLDKNVAAVIGNDGMASISNVKPGDHTIELRRDQALAKKFDRTFKTGDVVVLSGPDVALEKVIVDNKQAIAGAPNPATGSNPDETAKTQPNAVAVEGQQVRKGGGFVPYDTPKAPGRFSFQAQSRKGGLFKRGKVQWFAGYTNADNYVLYTLDGKRATVKEMRDGKSTDVGRIPFEFDSDEWIQVDMAVKSGSIVTRVKTPAGGWQDLPAVTGATRDLTQAKVGMYIPGNDEVAIANFHFNGR